MRRTAEPHTPALNQGRSMVNGTHEIWGFERDENSDCGLTVSGKTTRCRNSVERDMNTVVRV